MITAYNEISYFGFNFHRKSTSLEVNSHKIPLQKSRPALKFSYCNLKFTQGKCQNSRGMLYFVSCFYKFTFN